MKGLDEARCGLRGLKDFQLATVEHAFHRLFDAPDSTRRFLVADEVGLGKTMVARGLVARAIERLHADGVERIDVVYICSNGDIASQNVRKLDVLETGTAIASRLTLLAKQVRGLRERPLNIVALTPGTSFNQGSATGLAEERVLLHALLRDVWTLPDSAAPKNLLQATARSATKFRRQIREFPSLPTSRETVMTKELLSFEGEIGARDVVDGVEQRWRQPRSGASRRRAQWSGWRARRTGWGT